MKLNLATIAFIAGSTFTQTQAAQWELNLDLGLSYAEVKLPADEWGDEDIIGEDELHTRIRGSYYLQELNTDIGPLDQAAFLSKASKVTFFASAHGGYDGLAYRFDQTSYGKTYGMGFKGVIEDYILSVSHTSGELNGSYEFEDVTKNKLALGFGAYLDETSSIIVSYLNNSDNRDYFPNIGSGIVYREDQGIDVAGQFFTAFENGQSLGYGANIAILDTRVFGANATGTRFELGGHVSYHPTKFWTLKGEVLHTDFSKNNYVYKRNFINFSARYYFVEAFAMDLNLGNTIGEDEFGNVDGFQLGLGFKSLF